MNRVPSSADILRQNEVDNELRDLQTLHLRSLLGFVDCDDMRDAIYRALKRLSMTEPIILVRKPALTEITSRS